jgi:hypothetical protein
MKEKVLFTNNTFLNVFLFIKNRFEKLVFTQIGIAGFFGIEPIWNSMISYGVIQVIHLYKNNNN